MPGGRHCRGRTRRGSRGTSAPPRPPPRDPHVAQAEARADCGDPHVVVGLASYTELAKRSLFSEGLVRLGSGTNEFSEGSARLSSARVYSNPCLQEGRDLVLRRRAPPFWLLLAHRPHNLPLLPLSPRNRRPPPLKRTGDGLLRFRLQAPPSRPGLRLRAHQQPQAR